MTAQTTNPANKAAGLSLIEVLVALVVLSIGLLGFAALQINGLRNNNTALKRSLATIQAYDLSDRMRANPAGVANGDYDGPSSTQTTSCGTTSGCTAAQMAANDFYEWNQSLGSNLSDGQGFVCIDSAPDDDVTPADGPDCDGTGNLYTIYVTWTETVEGVAETRTLSMSFEP